MRRKKELAVLLTTVMATSMMAGCGSKEKSQEVGAEGASKQPISMVSVINNEVKPDDTDAWQYFLQDGKYNIEVDSYARDQIDEKINLMLSTNQYPDVFFKCHQTLKRATVDKYAQQGIFIALDELIKEHAPNLSKLLEERPEIKKSITSEDGKIYFLPGIAEQKSTIFPTWINEQWLNNLGLENPNNPDELYNVLKEFKEKDANGNGDPNDEIPVMMSITPAAFATSWMWMFGEQYDKESMTINNNGTLEDARACDAYKETLQYIAKLYQEKLIDQNIFTQTVAQAQAKGKGADVTGVTGGASPLTYCGPNYGKQFTWLNPFVDGAIYLNTGMSPSGLVITDKCEDPAAVLEWVDQMYGEDGSVRVWMGQEDVNFKWLDDTKSTYEWIIPEGSDVNTMRAHATLQGIGVVPSLQPQIYVTGNPDPIQKLANDGLAVYTKSAKDVFPNLSYSSSDLKTVASINADISAYADTYAAQVITGEADLDATWNDYLAQLETMGMSKMMTIKQASFEKISGI